MPSAHSTEHARRHHEAAVQHRAPVGIRRKGHATARYRDATTDLAGGAWRGHPLEDDRFAVGGRDHAEPLGRELFDPLRRAQRFHFEPEVAVDVAFGGAIALHLLEAVAVAQQLEVLPGREQQREHQHHADAERLPQIAQPAFVDFPHDLVVAEVLPNFVFESAFVHAPPVTELERRRAAWRCARADWLPPPHPSRSPDAWSAPSTSPPVPTVPPLVLRTTADATARGTCVSPRGLPASETRSGPSVRRSAASQQLEPINESSPSSSPLTQMRSAWKVRVAGSIRCQPRAATARRTISASRPVVSMRDCCRAIDDGARHLPRPPLFAELVDHVGELFLVDPIDQVRGGLAPRAIHPHVERLVAAKTETAALGVELHRRHAEIRQHPRHLADAVARRAPRRSRDSRRAPASRDRRTRERLARDGERVGVAIDPDQPRRATLEQHPRVTAEADRAIDESAAALRLQERSHFVDENRNVRRFRHGRSTCLRERDNGAFVRAVNLHAVKSRSLKAPSRRRR